MKTFKIILALFFAGIATLSAQNNRDKVSIMGIKGGYNLSAVNFNGEGETGQRHSFHIGFYGESFFNNHFSIQPELQYSQQGYVISNANGKFTQKLNYINLPLMLKAYPVNNFFLEVGPQIGLAVYHKEEYDAASNIFNSSQEFNPNKLDYGVNFGAGFVTDNGMSLGVRYHLGMGDVYNQGNQQNRVWQFSLGFDF